MGLTAPSLEDVRGAQRRIAEAAHAVGVSGGNIDASKLAAILSGST